MRRGVLRDLEVQVKAGRAEAEAGQAGAVQANAAAWNNNEKKTWKEPHWKVANRNLAKSD